MPYHSFIKRCSSRLIRVGDVPVIRVGGSPISVQSVTHTVNPADNVTYLNIP